jgi:hypothetical protein
VKYLATFLSIVIAVNTAAYDWSQACASTGGGIPYSYITGQQLFTLGVSPEHSCQLYVDQVNSNNPQLQYNASFELVNGNPWCTGYFVNGSGQLSGASIVGVCDPNERYSCAEGTGETLTMTRSTLNSSECQSGCSLIQNGQAVVVHHPSQGPSLMGRYSVSGSTCGSQTSPPAPPPNETDIPILDNMIDESCYIENTGNYQTRTCTNSAQNCGYWTDSDGNNVSGCVDSQPAPNGCVTTSNEDLHCDTSLSTSPPLPDNGTPGQVPSPNLTTQDPTSGEQTNHWDIVRIENSTYDYNNGGDGPPPGDDPPPETGECEGWFCDEPTGPNDYTDYSGIGAGMVNDATAEIQASGIGSPLGDAIDTSGINSWASGSGGSCVTWSMSFFNYNATFDQHCAPWDTYIRPLLAWVFSILTIWKVSMIFFATFRSLN